MYPYQKPQLALLLDLIKEANPGIQFPFTPETMLVGTPTSQAVPSGGIADTNVSITAKPNSHWFGTVRVQYRRIDVAKLFKNMLPLPVDYYANSSTADALRDKLNQQYGTSFVTKDFTAQGAISANIAFNQTIATSSLCYSPGVSFQLIWKNRKPSLSDVVPNAVLTGRLFLGGNDFTTPGRKPQGEYLAYGIDMTTTSLTGGNAGSGIVGTGGTWVTLVSPLAKLDPRFNGLKNHDVEGGIGGLTYIAYTLPSALLPEANSSIYKYALTIISQPNSWFQGRLILHYN